MHRYYLYTKLIIEKWSEFNLEMHLTFVDIKNTFDIVQCSLLWSILEQRGFPSQLHKVPQSLYYKTTIVLVLNGWLTENIPNVRQGCPQFLTYKQITYIGYGKLKLTQEYHFQGT